MTAAALHEDNGGGGGGSDVAAVVSTVAARLRKPAVAAVVFVIVFLYSAAVGCAILPWWSFSVRGVENLVVLTLTTAGALASYGACLVIEPGFVPRGWTPPAAAAAAAGDALEAGAGVAGVAAAAVVEVKRTTGGARVCSKCGGGTHKPPRAHHCRVCGRCVLRMDHHCPWTDTCIGHRNYRCFFSLLLYATAAAAHAAALLLAHTVRAVAAGAGGDGGAPTPPSTATRATRLQVTVGAAAALVALPTAFAVGSLLLFHVRMVLANKTTIEHAEGVTAQVRDRAAAISAISAIAGGGGGGSSLADDEQARRRRQQRHPYDLGVGDNLFEVLGDAPAMWLLPRCAPTRGGGTSFRTAFDAPRGGDAVWLGF